MTRKSIILVASALLLFAACNSGKDKPAGVDIIQNPNSAEGYDESQKMPRITFENDMHDFGQLMAGENISYSFKFTNTGNADLIISGCDASCGCTVAEYPHGRIAPGKSDYITVSFKSKGMSGQQMKEVIVASNAQPARTKLRITATVR
ncbi:MAG: DUF1573 domain-containing protein [Bacteroidales bacterium]|nr:DUF1573 domain-containing protein [Bacteroidales bacterium]MCR5191675.1 DUF1573 domain-containing protein [Bacteroidales bacterium]